MKRTVLLGTLLVLALLISACGPAQVTRVPSTSLPVASETPAATKAPVGTASPAVAATNTGTAAGTPSASATGTPEASVPVTGQAVVKAASNVDYGPILTTGDGLPLYIFDRDKQNGSSSACTDQACTTSWTPLTTEGMAAAGPGAIQGLLGTITREDGKTQVTYNGWPLYLYSGDTSSDTTKGQGAEPGWTLISPAGNPVAAK